MKVVGDLMEIQIRSESSQTHNKPPSPRVTKSRSQVWFFRVCSCILVWTCLFQLFTGLTNQISRFSLPVEPVRLLPPRRNYTSNGILRVSCNGGLNQMRAAICDMVTIARLLNLTLLVPELDKKSFWADPSDFEDVFDINHFIDSLRDEVRIIRKLPKRYSRYKLFQMPPVSWSNEKYYLHKLLPRFRKHKVIHFNRSDTRLANNGLSLHLQRLRCRVNFQGLRFTPRIEALGAKLVQILQQRGPFVALHLRYEMDMLAFSGCTHGCTEKEAEELKKMRYAYPWWKEKEIVSKERRVQGRCPLTPEEAVLVLKALGFQKDTQIYIAAGDIYGGERRLALLKESFPRIVKKEMLLDPKELQQFQNHSSQMAALDFIVSVASDTFIPTYYGNMAKVVEGHRRTLSQKNMNNNAEAAQEEEFSEWVVIQTSSTSSPVDASSPLSSPISQPSQGRDDDDEDSVVPVVEEEEEDESSSTVNQSFPWRVIETAKKRLKDSGIFERAPCNYVSSTRVFWSFTLICGFSLVSSLVYVKIVRWWRRLQEEKLRFLLLQLKEKDQKIKELIIEIGRLNESISSRRRVRVVRIL